MRELGNELIQAFPIGKGTVVLTTATDYNISSRSVIHVNGDGTLTFTFNDGTSTSFSVSAGMDFAIERSCVSISSDCEIWIA